MAAVAQEWFDWSRNQVQSYLSIHVPDVRPALPPKSFFKFPPSDLPAIIPPPVETVNFTPAFQIPATWYNAALAPEVPVTFALVYATVITYLNAVNRRRNKKPWAISKTLGFKLFVLAHNIFLASYSLWTFLGMLKALRVSVANPREEGLAATVDSLCKMNGPRGLGSAATYNETTSTWAIANHLYHLGTDGLTPDSTDVGRIWNEGLAFYGWLFYLSKFYEVIDTLIIIAKGKQSSFLQMYHHAGAMLCMWAGIRYMSPPIWMFVFVNSFIHYIMYFFYFVTAIGIKVPKPLKQTLTTLQITQFVVGALYAFAHYFVEYQAPVSIPYAYHLREVLRDAIPAIKSDASSAASVATATATADVAAWVKKLALRAAGHEGLAENVQNRLGQTFGVNAARAVESFVRREESRLREETRYRDDLQWIHCLDTSGETFAIWLNIFYLAPLTLLFAQFFINAYLHRAEERRRSSISDRAYIAGKSINEARKGVSRRLSEAFEDYQGANGEATDEVLTAQEIFDKIPSLEKFNQQVREIRNKASAAGESAVESVTDGGLQEYMKSKQQDVKSVTETVQDFVSEKTSQLSSSSPVEQAQDIYEQLKADAEAGARKVKEGVHQTAQSVETHERREENSSETWNVVQSAKKSVQQTFNDETTSNAADTLLKVEEKANEMSEAAVAKVGEVDQEVKKEADGVKKTSEEDRDAEEDAEKKSSDIKAEHAEAGQPSAVDEPSNSQSKAESNSNEVPEGDSKVHEGKTFADAAAEGVSEEAMGETVVIEDKGDDGTTEVKAEEGMSSNKNGEQNEATKKDMDEGA